MSGERWLQGDHGGDRGGIRGDRHCVLRDHSFFRGAKVLDCPHGGVIETSRSVSYIILRSKRGVLSVCNSVKGRLGTFGRFQVCAKV